MQPLTICAYEVAAVPVFDALDANKRAFKRISEATLACPNRERDMLENRTPASHAFVDQLRADGYVGLQVRSFVRGADHTGANLVLWQWGDGQAASIRVSDDKERLAVIQRK